MEEHKEKEEYVCLATYMGAVTVPTPCASNMSIVCVSKSTKFVAKINPTPRARGKED